MMSHRPHPLLLALLLAGAAAPANAANFVYEGALNDRDRPASGRYDLRLTLVAGPNDALPLSTIEFPATEIVDGRFRVSFDLPGLATGEPWVGLAVREVGAAAFTEIPGRSKATAGVAACWGLGGDAGTNADVNFLGTTDDEPLVLRTRNTKALTIEPSSVLSGGVPITANVIGGARDNQVTPGVRGATIGGGGALAGNVDPDFAPDGPNFVHDHYGTVGGGLSNSAGRTGTDVGEEAFATVGGGQGNAAEAVSSTVAGGRSNTASGAFSTIGGGILNNAAGAHAVVAGGNAGSAPGDFAVVSGGILGCAGADYSWVGGRRAKVRPPAGATAPGTGCAGAPTFGTDGDVGTFIWADSQNANFVSTGTDQFLVRALGGVAYNTNVIPAAIEMVLGNRGTAPNANVDLFMRSSADPRGINLGMLPGVGAAPAEFRIAQYNGTSFNDRVLVRGDGVFEVRGEASKPGGGPWAMSSDARLKHHVAPLSGTLDRLLSLQGVTFEFIDPVPGKRLAGTQVGFIAQEVQKVFPDWVSTDGEGYLMVASRGFEALTVEALRELRAESATIDAHQTGELDALEAQHTALQARLDRLERLLQDDMGAEGGSDER